MSTALTALGATDIDTKTKQMCNFKAPADLDIKAKLGEIASAKNKLEGWEIVE